MRKVSAQQAGFFGVVATTGAVVACALTYWLAGLLPGWEIRGVLTVLIAVILFYAVLIMQYRLFLRTMPLPLGEIPEGSRAEFIAQVNTLFYVILFYPLTRSHFIPTPLMRLLYLALGAKLGSNTYSGGLIMDPPLTRLGRDTLVGHDAVLYAHVIEGRRLGFYPITVGDEVTIGACAIIMPGVTVGDRAMVSAGAVVPKGVSIPPGEIWGGVPARKIGERTET